MWVRVAVVLETVEVQPAELALAFNTEVIGLTAVPAVHDIQTPDTRA